MESKYRMIVRLANINQPYIFFDLLNEDINMLRLTIQNDHKFFIFDNLRGSVMLAKDKIIAIEITKQ